MGYSKEWRDQKIKNGLCGTCGNKPHIDGQKECASCRDKRRKSQKLAYHNKDKEFIKKRRQKFKESGLCTRCGKNPQSDKLTCESCLQKVKEYQSSLKDKVYKQYGGWVCNCCGETTPEFLTLDHVNNDGAKHRSDVFNGRESSAGFHTSLYLWIIRNDYPDVFQVLCANCNFGKHLNGGICPHQK